jgi:hypothetical protein
VRHPNDELISELRPKADQLLKDVHDFICQNFDRLDLNGDGFLSKEELETALAKPGTTIREAAFLNFLLVRIREIGACYQEEWAEKPDCISKLDLEEYFSSL